jgi:hypothetical protein
MTDSENENGIEINKNLYIAIKETFEEELFKIFTKISNKYGKEYLFTLEDLMNFYKKNINMKFVYRKAPPKKENIERILTDKERCCARIWCNGYMNIKKKQYGSRCLRRKIKDSDYCRQHFYHLTHGRFDKPPSKIVKGFYIKENENKISSTDEDNDEDDENDDTYENDVEDDIDTENDDKTLNK